jgi:hypothetical protein
VDWVDLGAHRAIWVEGGERTAVVLPGAVGGAFQPPVYFTWLTLAAAGWSVLAVHAEFEGGDREAWPRGLAEAAFAHCEPALLAGKSAGTLAAGLRPELPAIWVTPLLDHLGVVTGLKTARAPQLLIGGTADPSWRPDVARRVPGEVVELEGANHGIAVDGDARASVELMGRLVDAVDGFARRI